MAEDAWKVSWDVTAIFGVVSALLGVALGLFGDRWLRYRGDVHCRTAGCGQVRHGQGREATSFKVTQSIQVHFFNEKEVDTGLSEIAVVFAYENGEELVLGADTRGYETSTSPRGVINLPSKTWVSVQIKGEFYGSQAQRIVSDPKSIEVKGEFPGGTLYREICSECPEERRRSWWRRIFGG